MNIKNRGWFRSGVGLAIIVASGLAVAQAEPDDALASDFFETATVRARELAQATASVTVLNRQEIEDLNVVSVAELIRFIPGVNVTPSGPRSGYATAQIRGGDPNYSVILLDGVPLNDINDQQGGTVNLNSLSTAHIERIEVVRGPLSSSFGSTGLAGAINIVTRRGSGDAVTAGVSTSAGSDSRQLVSAFVSGGAAESDYFIGLTWEHEEDVVAEDEFDQIALRANGRVQVGRAGELRLTGNVADWDSKDYPDASGGPDALCPPATLNCMTRNSEHQEVSLGLEWQIGTAQRRHKAYATVYRHDLDRQTPAYGPVPAAIEDTTFETWRLGWAAPQMTIGSVQTSFGAEMTSEDGTSRSDLGFGFPAGFAIDRLSGAAYVEMLAERGDVVYEFGARVDVPEEFDTEVSPRFGISYRPGGGATRWRGSVGRAFKLPSFFALATPVVGNPALVPEIVLGADIGVEHRFAATQLTASWTLFYNEFDELITFDGMSFLHVNLPEVVSKGVEFAIDWGGDGPVSFSATATGQDFDNKQSSTPLTNRPEWFGSARILWRINERVRWQVDGQWVANSFGFLAETGMVSSMAGYQLYGTSASYKLSDRFELQARVDNLTDKNYQTHIGFDGPGRSYRIGLRYR